jgi:hypothetical protein
MLTGAKSLVRTNLTDQLEEQGYIEAIMGILKAKDTPMPAKVAGVEVLKVPCRPRGCCLPRLLSVRLKHLGVQAMLADDDEATAESIKEKLDSYSEVRVVEAPVT